MDKDSLKKGAAEIQQNVKKAASEVQRNVKKAADDVQRNIGQGYEKTRDGVVHARKVTDQYVRENPWTVVGVSLGIGFLVGLLSSFRRR